MSPDFPPELLAGLLDDFYAECDEHLANLRAELARLEASLARSEPNPTALESVFRSVHTLKGNSAIVGLTAAEELAHATEGLLRSLTRRESPLTPDALDLIAQAGHRLGQIVSTFRLKEPMPDATALLALLRPYSEMPGAAAAPAPTLANRPPPESTAPTGLAVWHATFSPSAGRDARGVHLASVRTRLAGLGEILHATPLIQPGGGMTFEFTLALREPPVEVAALAADGIVLRPQTPAPADAPPGDGAGHSSLFIAPSHIVRVDLGRLDDLMRIASEMVIQRSRLEERISKLAGDRTPLQEVNLAFGRLLRDLRQAVTRVRLVPIAEIFSRLPFVARELSRESGKKLQLVLEGQDTEVDKYLVERLKEPLLHLVRNAVSHGIESPAERAAAGKPAEATLLLRASTAGDTVVIEIRDDGRGIDPARLTQRALALGLAVPEPLDGAAVLSLLCTPGFSTREQADRAAGRGVGLDVVANTVRELGGSLRLDSAPGQWTRFTLRLPLTLSITGTFIVSAATQICAVPQGCVEQILQIPSADVGRIQQVEVASYRAGLLPLVRLRSVFGAAPGTEPHVTVLVIGSDRGSAGLVVDRVHGQREVVVRPMSDPLVRVSGISGATELGDGKAVLILDAVALTSAVVRPRTGAEALAPEAAFPGPVSAA